MKPLYSYSMSGVMLSTPSGLSPDAFSHHGLSPYGLNTDALCADSIIPSRIKLFNIKFVMNTIRKDVPNIIHIYERRNLLSLGFLAKEFSFDSSLLVDKSTRAKAIRTQPGSKSANTEAIST